VHKRDVNDLIFASVDGSGSSEAVAFFCECSSPRCFVTVPLSAAEYEEQRRDGDWSVRAPGH
jgi:hypothetical protein